MTDVADRSARPAFLLALNLLLLISNLNCLAVFLSLWSGNQLLGIAVVREKEELREGDGVKEKRDECMGEGRTTGVNNARDAVQPFTLVLC